MGFDSILLKPFTSEELRGTVEKGSRTASRTRADAHGWRGDPRPAAAEGIMRAVVRALQWASTGCCPSVTASCTTPSSSASPVPGSPGRGARARREERARRATPRRARAGRRLRSGQLHVRARRGRLFHDRPRGVRRARRVAREKRRAKRLANLAFRHGELAEGAGGRDGSFDVVVSIHGLYVHPSLNAPARGAAGAQAGRLRRVRQPTRHVGHWSTFRDIKNRDGLRAAMASLLWLVPNSIFEIARKRIGPHYWDEHKFATNLKAAGFTVLGTRRTFLNGASVLVWRVGASRRRE